MQGVAGPGRCFPGFQDSERARDLKAFSLNLKRKVELTGCAASGPGDSPGLSFLP